MARPLWKGSISFGLVTVPIGLGSAIEAREELAFNLLHNKDGRRIVQKRFCKEEDVEVLWSDVVKGYQYAKEQLDLPGTLARQLMDTLSDKWDPRSSRTPTPTSCAT